jgi:hypothetical protein
MSEYTQLHKRIKGLEAQKGPASKRGIGALIAGIISLAAAIPFLLSYGMDKMCASLFWLTAGIGILLLAIGIAGRIRGHTRVRELDQALGQARLQLTPLEKERAHLLVNIRGGNLALLPLFRNCVFQDLPIDLLPDEDKLLFRPQSGETCLVQISNVNLGRLKSRTTTRKTGGGYRIGRIYVPVQKERIRITELDRMDMGTLAVTNHRVLYLGAERKLLTPMETILELEAYQDGLSITKDGRQSADIFLGVDGTLLSAVIQGVEAQQNAELG